MYHCSFFTRYVGMNKPPGTSIVTLRVAVAIIVFIWIYNVVFNVPMFLWATVFPVGYGRTMCNINSPEEMTYPIYLTTHVIINFYFPLALMWAAYLGIICKMKQSQSKVGEVFGFSCTSVCSYFESLHCLSLKVTGHFFSSTMRCRFRTISNPSCDNRLSSHPLRGKLSPTLVTSTIL
jgi:hypothetical protein